MRWIGLDLVALFSDSFFMAFMFLMSGLFVHYSMTKRGSMGYVRLPRLGGWACRC